MKLFQIEKHILPPMPRTRWNSVQYRLARKADNKLTYNTSRLRLRLKWRGVGNRELKEKTAKKATLLAECQEVQGMQAEQHGGKSDL